MSNDPKPEGEAVEVTCPICGHGFYRCCHGDIVIGHDKDCRTPPAPARHDGEVVERVAKAICEALGTVRWEKEMGMFKDVARIQAKAALAALNRSGEGK